MPIHPVKKVKLSFNNFKGLVSARNENPNCGALFLAFFQLSGQYSLRLISSDSNGVKC